MKHAAKTIFIVALMSIFLPLILCFESEPIQTLQFPPTLLEPQTNQFFPVDETRIVFRWQLNEYGNKIGIYDSCTIYLDGATLATVMPQEVSFTHTLSNPLNEGVHTWKVMVNCKGGTSFSAKSTFIVDNPSYLKNHSLDNLQAYIDDYLIIAIGFNEPMHGVELNKSVTIDYDASLSELETEDQMLYYFKVRNFEWNHPYMLALDSSIKNGVKNSLRQTSLRFHTPKEFPQPKCIGWIGGGKDGWQKVNGPFEERDTYYGGLGDREFSDAQDISLSPNEKMLYIVDPPNSRVQRWTTEGIYQGWIGGGKNGWQYGVTPPINWESPNQTTLNIPSALSKDIDGNIYIVNQGYRTIHKWDQEGNVVGWLGPNTTGWQSEPYIVPHAPERRDPTDFCPESTIRVNTKGDILFNDWHLGTISKFSKEGIFTGYIGQGKDGWQSKLSLSCEFGNKDIRCFSTRIRGLCVDQQGNTYISDLHKQWVIKWTKEGNAIGWIGHGMDGWQTGSVEIAEYGDHDLRSFSYPSGISIDSVGNLFVTDFHNHRVSKWTKDGKAIGWIGHGKDGWQTGDAPEYLPEFDGKGNMEINRIPGAEGIAVDSRGTIYVSGTAYYGYNWRVSKWVMDDGSGGGGTPVEP